MKNRKIQRKSKNRKKKMIRKSMKNKQIIKKNWMILRKKLEKKKLRR